MVRMFGVLLAGIIIGVGVGLAIGPAFPGAHRQIASEPPGNVSGTVPQATRTASKATTEQGRIVLGNIATVPFQELYGILATKPSGEIADVAKQLRDLPPGAETNAKITAFFKAWSHLDPSAAFKAALDLKTKEAKAAGIDAVIDGADQAMASTLAKMINELSTETLGPDQKQMFLSLAITKWSANEPAAAAAFADSFAATNSFMIGSAYHSIALNWARSDPQAALAWASTHSQGLSAQFVMSGAMIGWWEKDPRAAEEYVATRVNTTEGRHELSALASRIFNSDPQRAKDWVAGLSDAEARRRGDNIIATQMAWSDPKAAVDWAADLPGDVRSEVLSSSVSQWANTDPAGTAKWLEGTNGIVRDDALGGYVYVIAAKDPAAGLNLAMTIGETSKRDRAVESIVKNWMGRDLNSAIAWIQSTALPDETKQRLAALKPGG